MAVVRERFGIPDRIDRSVTEYPGWNGEAYIRYYTIVWVDEGGPQLKAHPYLGWCYRDETGSYGPLRTFDTPFDGYGQWDPRPADGELVDPGTTSEEETAPQPVIFEMDTEEDEPMEWESDLELEPMDLELEPVVDSEEEPVETESEPDSMDSELESDDASESSGSDPDWLP